MQTSIATVSLSGGLAEKLEALAAADLAGVEIFESDLLSFKGTPKDVARMVASLGLKIVTFQPFRDFEGMPEPQRSRTFARAERKFDLMGELGCDLLMICSNVAPDSLGGIERAAADCHKLGERAAKRGIRVGFQALAWGNQVTDYGDHWEGGRRADRPPRAKCVGTEFLELADDDRAAAGLAKLFAGLGFRKVGEHKSKAVAHWSQGAIHLVLNSDKEGFAHSHQLSHGASVCAICLKVDDATATLDRAEKLRD